MQVPHPSIPPAGSEAGGWKRWGRARKNVREGKRQELSLPDERVVLWQGPRVPYPSSVARDGPSDLEGPPAKRWPWAGRRAEEQGAALGSGHRPPENGDWERAAEL